MAGRSSATYTYQTSPNEKRDVAAGVAIRRTACWTVAIDDMAQAVGEKRGAQVGADLRQAAARRATRASRSPGKKAHKLDEARIAELSKFVERRPESDSACPACRSASCRTARSCSRAASACASSAASEQVDGDTLLHDRVEHQGADDAAAGQARRREQAHLGDPGHQLLPTFKLGDADTTSRVLVEAPDLRVHRHAAAGHGVAVSSSRASRRTARWRRSPRCSRRSKFGELFQYSNLLAGAAGFVGGHVLFPKLELGAAYDKAMQTLGVRSARHEGDHLRLRARARRQPRQRRTRPTSTASRRAAVMEIELLDHSAAPGRRGVEQRQRHAEVRRAWSSPRASCRTASATSRRSRCSPAPRPAGARSARTRPTAWG